MPGCPRCTDTPLIPSETHGVGFHSCPSCEGVLIPQRQLVPLVEGMIAECGMAVDHDHQIEAQADPEEDLDCPSCSRRMTRFGYMGMNLVQLDRCGACEVLWTDASELSVVSVLFARTQTRLGARKDARREAEKDRDRRFDILMQQQRWRRFLGVKADVALTLIDLATQPQSRSS